MNRVFEAPKSTTHISKLRRKAAQSENFCQLVCTLREMMVDHCASAHHMRQALALAVHEQAWSNYRLTQGVVEEPDEIVEEIVEEDEDEEEGLV